ncbi:hypothetical protein [Propionicicella superfundia]|uniref:hypothetical protein n=1 Tax=Propionicicella superfundia TaxID=348582 RepID=UPI000400ECDF|nr:hypothetical protein [Propionicicella superfundia]
MKIECDGRLVAATAVAAPVAAVMGFTRYAKQYLVAPEDAEGPYPGDELLTDEGASTTTMAIEIDAPPEKVWPLINQLGQDKAGFYSFSLFERAVHFLIHNTYTPQARWQDTTTGDWCFYGQQGIGHEIVLHEPGKHIVGLSDSRKPPTQDGAIAWIPAGMSDFAWTWGFFLEPLPGDRTRFVTRSTAWGVIVNKLQAGIVAGLMWGWSSGVMQTRMLQVIKACAEDRWFLKI